MLEKSKAYFEQGRFDKALKWITRCTNGDMQNKEAWELKVEILAALSQPNEAEDCREIVEDIQKKRERETREKTPELQPSKTITLNLDSLTAARQLAALLNGCSEEKRLRRK